MRLLAKGGSALLVIGECLAVAALVALFLEAASRVAHWGNRPAIAVRTDEAHQTRLPIEYRTFIKLSGRPVVRLCTDDQGLRTIHCNADAKVVPVRVLGVGDSQVLGWGMELEETFTAKAGKALYGENAASGVRLMAAAGADVESLAAWARDFARAHPDHLDAKIIAVNLGNDLDEMFLGRSQVKVKPLRKLSEWLSAHSFFILDFNIFKKAFITSEWEIPPGANPVLFALNAGEREQLAVATADAVQRLAQALPPSAATVVVLIPNDYQIDPPQFDKYRSFYPSEALFEGWRRRVEEAARRLDTIEATIARELTARGVRVAMPRAELAKRASENMFDGASHHYTALGHDIMARSILAALSSDAGHR